MKLSRPQTYAATTLQEITLFLSGIGGGKTHFIGVKSGYLLQHFPRAWGFIGANTYKQLSQSTLLRVRAVWEEAYGFREGDHYVVGTRPPKHYNTRGHRFDTYASIISFRNGTVVYTGSLENAKAHDGKEFNWAFLDETKDTRQEDVQETILGRLRRKGIAYTADGQLVETPTRTAPQSTLKPFNPLYICTSPAKVRWINEWFDLYKFQPEIMACLGADRDFFRREYEDKCVVIASTHHNAENLPDGYIDRILSNNTAEAASKLIDGNPFVKSGGEFYGSFKRSRIVKICPYDPSLPLHITFDQNVAPYITMNIHQLEPGGDGAVFARQIDEICLRHPRNRSSKLAYEFIKRYPSHDAGVFYYGDPSGRKRDTRTNEHDYDIIRRILAPYLTTASNRVPYRHPAVLKRRDFINGLFEGVYPHITIEIDPKCTETLNDYEFLKTNRNGKKHKELVRDKNTGATYEKYGHTSDANDYFYCEVFRAEYENHFT